MFKNVIVKRPCSKITDGITSSPELGVPDYQLALKQHDAYIEAMKACGVSVTVLDADEQFPDSCFVEDTAVLTPKCAIITNPGADSRKKEVEAMIPVLRNFYAEDQIERIHAPGTLEGGDVMRVGDHFYIGLSDRTNKEGIRQFISILEKYGYTGSAVPLTTVLHLKTGVTYLENNNLLVSGEFIDKPEFDTYHKIIVPDEEAYAVNCIWMNGTIIVPEGFPTVLKLVQDAGYPTITVPLTEYRKIDGGLTCLSLRF